MKKIALLVLFVVFTAFAQQQDAIPRHSAVQAPPIPVPQDTLPEPIVPLVPAQPIPEELVPIAPPQMPLDSTHAIPVAQQPQPTDSASVAPPPAVTASIAPTPAPAPKDTTPPPPQTPSMPKHTITVDLGPTIIGAGVDAAAKTLGKKLKGVEISALGFAAQYEFQPIRFLSLPLKFAYMGFKTGVTEEKTFEKTIDTTINTTITIPLPDGSSQTIDTTIDIKVPIETTLKAKLKAELSISSIEAHPRLYPFGGSFFLEGMLGYANLSTNFSGQAIAKVKIKVPELPDFPDIPGITPPESENDLTKDTSYTIDVNLKASRSYLKYGGKLGWRVDFGKPGGFIFEHALGFYGASGLGKTTIVKKLADYVEKEAANAIPDNPYKPKAEIGKFDDAFSLLEKFIFVGGPRYTFAFGWRF